jgi:Domain of unknown function (DUF4070)
MRKREHKQPVDLERCLVRRSIPAGWKKQDTSIELQDYQVLKTIPREFRWQSARFLWSVFKKRPELLPGAVSLVLLGLHFCQFSREHLLPQLDKELAG